MTIDKWTIGSSRPIFIIAEAGVNHNGDLDLARELVKQAKAVGADCVKFQTFAAKNLVTKDAPKAKYQLAGTNPKESQESMLKRLELNSKDYQELIQLCRDLDILFLSTPYNISDVDFLEKIGVAAYKLASMHLTEHPMIEYTAGKQRPIFLATGMSNLQEVIDAATVCRRVGNDDVVLLQCTTDYPSLAGDAHLRTMQTMSQATDMLVGYSDHTLGIEAAVLAVGAGACVIEKHFTLDKNLPGPDHSSSSDPEEFARLVKKIREAEIIMGNEEKQVTERERLNIQGMRRSLAALRPISRGEKITADMLGFKRPASGLEPNMFYKVIGKTAKNDISGDSIITKDDIVW